MTIDQVETDARSIVLHIVNDEFDKANALFNEKIKNLKYFEAAALRDRVSILVEQHANGQLNLVE